MRSMKPGLGLAAAVAGALWATSASAALTFYQGAAGLAAFNAAAGNPAIAVNFDTQSGDISNQTINGVTFFSLLGNSMDVIPAASTYTTDGFIGVTDASTNKLPATSGRNILSPGGAALVPGGDIHQVDDLLLYFNPGVRAFGLDILFQSLDLSPGVVMDIGNPSLRFMGSYTLLGNGAPGGAPGGSVFWGVTSDTDIGTVDFIDTDNNNIFPDSNIGYDTLRFGTTPAPPGDGVVPEPASWMLMIVGFGAIGGLLRGRRLAAI